MLDIAVAIFAGNPFQPKNCRMTVRRVWFVHVSVRVGMLVSDYRIILRRIFHLVLFSTTLANSQSQWRCETFHTVNLSTNLSFALDPTVHPAYRMAIGVLAKKQIQPKSDRLIDWRQ